MRDETKHAAPGERETAGRSRSAHATHAEAGAAPPREAFGRPLVVRRPPLCPEIPLWLLDGAVDLEAACRDLDACHPPPYWAFCWGAGQALARFVLDRPALVRGRTVVDYGAGCGIVAVAAARAGAARVVAVDTDPSAREAVSANASLSGVAVATAAVAPDEAEVVLAADVLYEAGNLAWLRERRADGRTVVVADPGRAASPDLGRPAAARYAATTLPDCDSPMRAAAVYVL